MRRLPQPCADHLGRQHMSKRAMARAWGVHFPTMEKRLALGWSLKAALTGECDSGNMTQSVDPKGRKFRSFRSMCLHYGILPHRVQWRLDHGWSLADALRPWEEWREMLADLRARRKAEALDEASYYGRGAA